MFVTILIDDNTYEKVNLEQIERILVGKQKYIEIHFISGHKIILEYSKKLEDDLNDVTQKYTKLKIFSKNS